MTDDELEYLRHEQAKFQFYRKVEARQNADEKPSAEPMSDSAGAARLKRKSGTARKSKPQ